jgi:hypothetical protein
MAQPNHYDHHDAGVQPPFERTGPVPDSPLLAGEEVDPL